MDGASHTYSELKALNIGLTYGTASPLWGEAYFLVKGAVKPHPKSRLLASRTDILLLPHPCYTQMT